MNKRLEPIKPWKIIHTLEQGYVVVDSGDGKYNVMQLHNSGGYRMIYYGELAEGVALDYARKLINPPKHRCVREMYLDSDVLAGYGEAVDICMETKDGSFVVENEEGLSSKVNYCPYCGTPADRQLPLKAIDPDAPVPLPEF